MTPIIRVDMSDGGAVFINLDDVSSVVVSKEHLPPVRFILKCGREITFGEQCIPYAKQIMNGWMEHAGQK